MGDHEIATAILSVSTPGVQLDPSKTVAPEARAMARQVNEYTAKVASDSSGRFGFSSLA